MKVTVENKKGLNKDIKVFIDKKTMASYMEEKYQEIKSTVNLKGFRPGKVPKEILKRQFGKAVFSEVLDKVLKDTSTKALEENKIKPAGQPKLDLKTYGEDKELEYIMSVTELPKIDIKSIKDISFDEYSVKIDTSETEKRLKEIAKNQPNFIEGKPDTKASEGDLVVLDYNATVDDKTFKGSEGKNTQLTLGKDLFLKGFDKQLIGVKKDDIKIVEATLPENFPEKDLANKKSKFTCKIISVKKPEEVKINDDFAKSSLIFTSSGFFTEIILHVNFDFLLAKSFSGKFSGNVASTILISSFLTPINCLSKPFKNKSFPKVNCVFFPSLPLNVLSSTVAL